MDASTYLDTIRDESARLIDAALTAGPDRAVPSCPEWTVADLLDHIGTVQRWAATIVEHRLATPEWNRHIDIPIDPDARVDWVRAGTARLLDVLRSTPTDTPIWTFGGPGTAVFWYRRQAQEVALHRVDAELAAGAVTPLETELARDGIDELLDVFVPLRLGERMVGSGETLHFHRTDGEGEWLVRLTPDGPEVEHAHAKGDVAVRGGASDLLLVLRNRSGLDAVEVFGDHAVLARWQELARI